MRKLTIKQQKFIDEYIISGNATQAAIKAGYSKKTARFIGVENLTKPYISKLVKEKLKKIEDARTMRVEEAIQIASSIARGEVQKGYKKVYDKLTGEVEAEIEYEFTPRIEERQKSLEHILRCNGAFTDKLDINANAHVEIIDDIEVINGEKVK